MTLTLGSGEAFPNNVDDDCDGMIDEGTVAYDDDGDGQTEREGDCNDADPAVYEGAPEVPDCKDNDCDGDIEDPSTRRRVDDAYERAPDADPHQLPGAVKQRRVHGLAWGYRTTSASLDLVSHGVDDAERFEVWTHDGNVDTWHVTATIPSMGDHVSYRVEINGAESSTSGFITKQGGSVHLLGTAGEDNTGVYTVTVTRRTRGRVVSVHVGGQFGLRVARRSMAPEDAMSPLWPCLVMSLLAQPAWAEPTAEELEERVAKLWEESRYAEAEPLARRHLAILEKRLGPDHPDVATSLNNLAALLANQGDFAGARPLAERVVTIWEDVLGPDHPEVAFSLDNLASLHDADGDFAGARQLLERSLAIREAALGPDHVEVADSLSGLALLLSTQGDYAGARPLLERSLAIREEAHGPNHPEVATSLNNMAGLLDALGDYGGARSLLERSLNIWEENLGSDHPEVALGLNNLAAMLEAQGDYAGARPLYERSLAIWEEAFDFEHPDVAIGLNNLAGLLEAQGDYAGARPLYERSLAIWRAVYGPGHPDVGTSLNNLAGLLLTQGDYAGARPLYEEALAISEQVFGSDHPDVALSLNNLAILLHTQGDYAGARLLYERSLSIREEVFGPIHPDVATSLNNLAGPLEAQGDYSAARPLYERSLAIREQVFGPDHPIVANSLNNLATLLNAQGDHIAARPLLERSLTIREDVFSPDHPEVASSLAALAAVLRANGDHAGARPLLERSLAIRESRFGLLDTMGEREALAYLAESRKTLDNWLLAIDGPSDTEHAWSTTLRWKGAATRRTRELSSTSTLDPEARELRRQLRESKAQLARLTFADNDADEVDERREQLISLTRDKEDLERQLAAASAEWRRERATSQAGAAEVCAALPDGTGLVDFLRYGRNYLAFAVVAPGCEVDRIELGDAAAIDARVTEWREAMEDSNATTLWMNDRGQSVRQLVWDPLKDTVAGAEHLIVVPDGGLSGLPLGALPVDNARYLIEELPIGYLENAQDLLRAPSGREVSGALVVGAVDFGGAEAETPTVAMAEPREATRAAPCVSGDYDPLPGTVDEVDAVTARWGKSQHRDEEATVLTGGEATEAAVNAALSGRRIVHLATHGFFADAKCKSVLARTDDRLGIEQSAVGFNPMLLSGIVLAGSNAEHGPLDKYDGILTAEELSTVDLRGTELVVLSACETGLGEVQSGEGVLGLRRAFAAAGVQHLVMSLWSVPDQATSELMQAFYLRILHRNPRKAMSPPDAMREAQLELLERNRQKYSGGARPGDWAAFVVSGAPE